MKHRTPIAMQKLDVEVRVFWGVICAFLVVVTFRSIQADDFWWHMSRGRAVITGTIAPSKVLLASEQNYEADWFGGVPFYLIHQMGGISVLMGAKILLVGGVAIALVRSGERSHRWITLGVVLTGLVGARSAWEPLPILIEIGLLIWVWRMVTHWSRGNQTSTSMSSLARPQWASFVRFFFIFLVWANVGEYPLIGLLILVTQLFPGSSSAIRSEPLGIRVGLIASVICALCITPAGPSGVWHGFQLLFPWIVAESQLLEGSPWQALGMADWGPAVHAFLVLSVGVIILKFKSHASAWRVGEFILIQILAWSSEATLPLATIWLVLFALEQLPGLPIGSKRPWAGRQRTIIAVGCGLIATIFLGLLASGRWPGDTGRMSWGLSYRLEPHLASIALDGQHGTGTVHAVDVRAAGMFAWIAPTELRPWTTPKQALLRGEFRHECLLNLDLATGMRDIHRRADGSAAGWWLPLAARDTKILAVPAHRTDLIAALEPTLWKPLSLDAPVIPYGRVDDQTITPRIVLVLRERQFVNSGPWSYSPPPPTGSGSHFDIWGALLGSRDRTPILEQSAVFRAMEQPIGALRVLVPLRLRGMGRAALDEFIRCQLDLAYQERLHMGRASEFRAQTVAQLIPDGKISETIATGLCVPAQLTPNSTLKEAIQLYARGDYESAIGSLAEENAESLYAKALIRLEAGQPVEALELLDALAVRYPDRRIVLQAETLRAELGSDFP